MKVLRVTNDDVLEHPEAVANEIARAAGVDWSVEGRNPRRSPPPNPPPKGGRACEFPILQAKSPEASAGAVVQLLTCLELLQHRTKCPPPLGGRVGRGATVALNLNIQRLRCGLSDTYATPSRPSTVLATSTSKGTSPISHGRGDQVVDHSSPQAARRTEIQALAADWWLHRRLLLCQGEACRAAWPARPG